MFVQLVRTSLPNVCQLLQMLRLNIRTCEVFIFRWFKAFYKFITLVILHEKLGQFDVFMRCKKWNISQKLKLMPWFWWQKKLEIGPDFLVIWYCGETDIPKMIGNVRRVVSAHESVCAVIAAAIICHYKVLCFVDIAINSVIRTKLSLIFIIRFLLAFRSMSYSKT